MKCPACQKENRSGAAFCAFCGSPLKEAEEQVPPQDQEQQEQLDTQSDTESEDVALSPGDWLGERFEIIDIVEQTDATNTYRVRDWCRCAHCGYDDNSPGDHYCLDCGADLEKPVYATIVEQVPSTPENYDIAFTANDRQYYLTLEEPETEPPIAPAAQKPLKVLWGLATDKGITRDHNEDSAQGHLYTDSNGASLGLYIVADGLGGQDSGEVASQLAVETLWQSIREAVWTPLMNNQELDGEQLHKQLEQSVIQVNDAVVAQRNAAASSMSTTLTFALVRDATAYVANVGDSRTYIWNASGLRQVSHDHSLVQQLIDAGQITREEAYSHPQRNLIYQSIGDGQVVQPDIYEEQLQDGDRLILCSDGLWEMVRDDGIERVMLTELDPQKAAQELVRLANLAGGEDNISVIVVRFSRA